MVLLNMGAPKTDTKFLKSDSEGDYLLVFGSGELWGKK